MLKTKKIMMMIMMMIQCLDNVDDKENYDDDDGTIR